MPARIGAAAEEHIRRAPEGKHRMAWRVLCKKQGVQIWTPCEEGIRCGTMCEGQQIRLHPHDLAEVEKPADSITGRWREGWQMRPGITDRFMRRV